MNPARYVAPGTDGTAIIRAARADGIRRLTDVRPEGMRAYVTEAALREMGVPLSGDGTFTGRHAVAMQLFESYVEMPDAVRPLSVDAVLPCELEWQTEQARQAVQPTGGTDGSSDPQATASLPSPTSPNGSTAPSSDGATTPPATLAEAISARLRDLVWAVGRDDALDDQPKVSDVNADLAGDFSGGPADVPSLHDFHSLQVAWEDVWTSVLDGQLAALMAEAYDKVVEVIDWGTLAPDLSELTELNDFLDRMHEAVDVAGGVAGLSVQDTLQKVAGWADDVGKPLEQPQPTAPEQALTRLQRLLSDIATRLAEPYRFDVFKECTHNFGMITTYRQSWRPLTYQVGEMVGAIPLTPGEKRSYTKKRTVKVSRAQKEVEKALSSRHGESTETSRAEAEIVRKAQYSTNFTLNAEGGFTVGVAHVSGGQEYKAAQGTESSRVKRDFHEAVRKSAQEYRNERTVEVSTEQTTTDEFTETGEISNANNELTVTYLFYELQRRYEISERLHMLTPVILVAFGVPAPDAITEEWLLRHDWILRRVLLDDNLLPALDVLSDTFAGDELAVEVLRRQWETQLEVVQELHRSSAAQSRAQHAARQALEMALAGHVSSGGDLIDSTLKSVDKLGVYDKVSGFLFGGGGDDSGAQEALEARRQAAQKALEWAESDLAAISEQLAAAVSALQQATDAYTAAIERRLNRRVAIDQLRLHVKQNILYYMQAIWLHEPPDQRYLRIYNKDVEWPQPQEPTYVITTVGEPAPGWRLGGGPDDPIGSIPGQPTYKQVTTEYQPPVLGETRKLHQVADLDNLLGFRGNYAIFPLIERNGLTDFMMQSYLDSYFTLVDPDPLSQIPPPSDAIAIAQCAWQRATTPEQKQEIADWLVKMLANQRQVAETIVVPTGQLFVEALPGTHPVLEDFKLRHRQADVHRARAEALQGDLEALRYAARIAAGQLADPQVQTQIVAPQDGPVTLSVGTGQPTP
jgi:hypothetical protein